MLSSNNAFAFCDVTKGKRQMVQNHAWVHEASLNFRGALVIAQREQHQATNALRITFSRVGHLNDLPGDNLGYWISSVLQSERPTAGLERCHHRMNGRRIK